MELGTDPVQTSGCYRAWQIANESAPAIDLAWYSRCDYTKPERHDLLPFTEPSIALRRRFSPNGETSEWGFVIFRAQPDGGRYDPSPGEELFALRLAPEQMEAAFALKAADHIAADYEVPSHIACKLEPARRLADQEQFKAAWDAMLSALQVLAEGCKTDRAGQAARLARETKGMFSPAQIAEEAGLSPRHMRRLFLERLGLSPRAVLRRQRLTAAMLNAETFDRPQWAALAAGHNFSDQAHLIRECRALTGYSPGEWHRFRRGLAVSFNT